MPKAAAQNADPPFVSIRRTSAYGLVRMLYFSRSGNSDEAVMKNG